MGNDPFIRHEGRLPNNSNSRGQSDKVIKAAKSSRQIKKMSSSMSELRLTNMTLHGREDDMKVLKEKLLEIKGDEDRMIDTLDRRPSTIQIGKLPELVLISGISGTGKTSLVMKGLRDPAARMSITFVGGKFDLNKNTSMPLSAFVGAMASLAEIVSGGDLMQYIQDDMSETFGEDDMNLLDRAFPGCEKLFCHDDGKSFTRLSRLSRGSWMKKSKKESLLVGREAIARLQYAIRSLLKIICTHLKGLVLFLDDLQWADTATLDLLKSISLDSDIPRLLLVGAYREDEVTDTHPLALQIKEKEQIGIHLTSIQIGNLDLSNVTSLIAEALRMEDNKEAVKTLAETVHRKTEGNAFFVLLFLRSIHDENLLQYNFGIMKWTWDDDAVSTKLATENVTTVLVNKLRRLDSKTRSLVKVASCLGNKFSLSAVEAISAALSDEEVRRLSSEPNIDPDLDADDDETFASSIEVLEEEGLWEKESEDRWQFGHDKIQSAAFELIALDKRSSFQGTIGTVMLEKLDPEALEANLFEVVSLRNCGSPTSERERKSLATMNLQAGMKASENAAFDSAAAYFKKGFELLGSNGWEDSPFMLKLCSNGANASFLCGDSVTMNQMIDEVLRRDIPVVDKFNVYEVKIKAAYGEGKFNDAIETAFEFRRQIGLPTPKNKPANAILIIKEFIKTNRALGSRTAEDIANLPELTDERLRMGQRMLELSTFSSFQVQPTIYPLIVFIMVRASLKYGINASSCDAFSGLALLLCGFRKYKLRIEMSKVVDLILDKPGMDHVKARCMMLREGTIHHWVAPVHDTLAPLLEGYQLGLKTGDNENAASNLIIRVFHLYYAGRPLESLEHEMQTMINAMNQLNQSQAKLLSLPYLFVVKTLSGTYTEDSEMSLEGIRKHAEATGNVTLRAQSILCKLELSVFFQQWEDAACLLTEAGDLGQVLLGFFAMTRFTYLEGLISIRTAKASTATAWTKKRKWKKRADKATKLIRKWVKIGNGNMLHYLHLLLAEVASFEGKHEEAKANYSRAMSVSATNGFVHDKAVINELASTHFESIEDEYWSDYYIQCCIKCYEDWGAVTKVNQLKKRLSR